MKQLTGSKLGREYEMVTHSNIFAWKIPWTEEPCGLQSVGSQRATLMAEIEEKVKCLLIKVKEESEKAGLKLDIQKTKDMACSSITLGQIGGEMMETVTDYFLGLQNHCR